MNSFHISCEHQKRIVLTGVKELFIGLHFIPKWPGGTVINISLKQFITLQISALFLKKNYLFTWERETEREHEQWGGAEGEGEEDFPLSREPHMGLDPKTLRSWP